MIELKDVQRAALRKCAAAPTNGFAYFMQQGLGKTLTSFVDFDDKVQSGQATRKVVLCPNSFKRGWLEEAAKWGMADKFSFHLFESGDEANRRFVRSSFERPPIMVVNYEAIRSQETQDLIQEFAGPKPSFITADESVQIKGHDSAQTKAALALASYFDYWRLLSGKPTPQGPDDLWSQLRFIRLLNGFGFYPFRYSFCKMGGFKGKKVVGSKDEEGLAELMEPHVFWARKEDWTDLPPKTYLKRYYKLHPKLEAAYAEMRDEFVVWLEEHGEEVSVDVALAKYAKLIQIQSGFIINENKVARDIVSPKDNGRLQLLLDILANEVEGKACVTYVNIHVYDMLNAALTAAGYKPAVIRGNMTPDAIEAEKRRFNNDPSCRVILLQKRAAKYGHTLLGGPEPINRCSSMVFFQNSYSLDDRDQIEDRIHRHGQTARDVVYFDLVGTDMDSNIIDALQNKENVFQAVFQYFRKS